MFDKKEWQPLETDPLTKLWTEAAAKERIDILLGEEGGHGDVLYLISLDGWDEFQKNKSIEKRNIVLQQAAFVLKKISKYLDVVARIEKATFLLYELGSSAETVKERGMEIAERIEGLNQEIQVKIGAFYCCDTRLRYREMIRCAEYALFCAQKEQQGLYLLQEYEALPGEGEETWFCRRVIDDNDPDAGIFDVKFVTELINTVFLCNDVSLGIEMALERVCRYYHVGQVMVVERSLDKKYYKKTYEWEETPLKVVNHSLETISAILVERDQNMFDENGMFVCNCLLELKNCSHIMAMREKIWGTKAFMRCAFGDGQELLGYINVRERKRERLWSRTEIVTFLIACRVITAGIYKARQNVTLADTSETLH
ncbi:MAG: diguanylate cyclase domain-containing protein [Blautia sp.]|jgi:GGDEF domain-containing protein